MNVSLLDTSCIAQSIDTMKAADMSSSWTVRKPFCWKDVGREKCKEKNLKEILKQENTHCPYFPPVFSDITVKTPSPILKHSPYELNLIDMMRDMMRLMTWFVCFAVAKICSFLA